MTVLYALIASCSLNLKIEVFNNSNSSLTLITDNKRFAVEPGNSAQFVYPRIADNHSFDVSIRDCVYRYSVPQSPEGYYDYEGFDGVVLVQLEENLALYLVPPNARPPIEVDSLDRWQVNGFPISPVHISGDSNSCAF